MGKMYFTMAAGFADMERNLNSGRAGGAFGQMKASGQAYTRIPPLSFDRASDKLVENPQEKEIVRKPKSYARPG